MRHFSKSVDKDWKRLFRCLGFLKKTINDKRTFNADNVETLFTWVDASHAIHNEGQFFLPHFCAHSCHFPHFAGAFVLFFTRLPQDSTVLAILAEKGGLYFSNSQCFAEKSCDL